MTLAWTSHWVAASTSRSSTADISQNDNKTLQDNLKHNSAAYDEKYAALLGKLEGIQEEKDHPKKQVVDMTVDTLWVIPGPEPRLGGPTTGGGWLTKWTGFGTDSSRLLSNTSCESFTSIRKCGQRSSRCNITCRGSSGRRRPQRPKPRKRANYKNKYGRSPKRRRNSGTNSMSTWINSSR